MVSARKDIDKVVVLPENISFFIGIISVDPVVAAVGPLIGQNKIVKLKKVLERKSMSNKYLQFTGELCKKGRSRFRKNLNDAIIRAEPVTDAFKFSFFKKNGVRFGQTFRLKYRGHRRLTRDIVQNEIPILLRYNVCMFLKKST